MTQLKGFSVVVGIVLLSGLLLSFSETPKVITNDHCRIQNETFIDGEHLVYKMYYNLGFVWVAAGEVVFTVEEKPATFEMKAVGKTYKSYDKIFRVNDYFFSSVNKETLFPNNFVRVVEEGNYRIFDSISFDQNRNMAISYHGSKREDAKPQVHHLKQCMQDIVSNIYYMRNLDTDGMKKGDKIAVNMLFDKEIYPINIRYNGREKKDVRNLGKFNTIKIHPDLVAGNVFKDGDKMTIWVSDDKNKIPLIIESPVSVGSVKAVLKSYKGLKYDLISEIKD